MSVPPSSKPEKIRLDQLLFERGYAESRSKAEAIIRTGDVLVSDSPVDKPGVKVSADADVRIRGNTSPYVGRGGDKLAGAISHFSISVDADVCLDVGASTGGFTDCLLQQGAARVYAVDVGRNQLAQRIRMDPRVDVFEKCNARTLRSELFAVRPQFACIDVSFISVRKILPAVIEVLESPARLLILVKPQFELEKESVGAGGVVRSEEARQRAVDAVTSFLSERAYDVVGSVPSSLTGNKKGNQEYFVYAQRTS